MDHFGLRESTLCYERIEMGYSACVHSLLNFLKWTGKYGLSDEHDQ